MYNKDELTKTVMQLAEPLARVRGLVIWGIELTGSPLEVRVFVDIPQAGTQARQDGDLLQPASASADQCEEISRELGLALDVEDCIPQRWILEVSTPGLERKFFKLSQMRPYAGDLLEVKLSDLLDNPPQGAEKRRQFCGRLLEVGDDDFLIQPCQIVPDGSVIPENAEAVSIPWKKTRLAKRIHLFPTPHKPGKPSGKKKAGVSGR